MTDNPRPWTPRTHYRHDEIVTYEGGTYRVLCTEGPDCEQCASGSPALISGYLPPPLVIEDGMPGYERVTLATAEGPLHKRPTDFTVQAQADLLRKILRAATGWDSYFHYGGGRLGIETGLDITPDEAALVELIVQ